MKTEIYDIEGMHCAACSSAIERVTRKLDGVERSEVNLPMNRLSISYNEEKVTPDMITGKIKKAGFSAQLRNPEEGNKSDAAQSDKKAQELAKLKQERTNLILSIIVSVVLLYVAMGQMLVENLPIPDVFSMHTHPVNYAILQMLLALVVIGLERRFFISGFTSLFHKNPNMDTLVAISSTTAFLYSLVMTFCITDNIHAVHQLYFESAAIVLALVSVGKYMEGHNKEKTKSAIESMMKLTPDTALLVDENGQWEVPTEKLQVGNVVLVKAGQSIPLDGVITEGGGSVNEAMLTGESLPVEKQLESEVIGGSILVSGAIYVKITRCGEDTALAKIIKFVEDAQGKKAPISKLADRVAGVFVPVVIVIATVAAIVWLVLGSEISFALTIFTAILVIACPCSLGLATPTSIIVGTGVGAGRGILIRNGEALETAHKVGVVIFDKTGTITKGEPVVTDVCPKGMEEKELLEILVNIEQLSDHPIAKAICNEGDKRHLAITLSKPKSFENVEGGGILAEDQAGNQIAVGNYKLMQKQHAIESEDQTLQQQTFAKQGKTVIYVAKNQELLGWVCVADEVKPEAKATIERLKSMHIQTIMLTGDNRNTAEYIGQQVGIDEIVADVLPTEKASVVQRFQEQGHVVMMVGDGINDAPALVQAEIGCAVGNGSDIAIDSAEIILMKNSLTDVPAAIELSRKTIKNIKENLFWAFCYNTLCIPIAAGVLYIPFSFLLSPMIGGFAMSLSSLFVVGNALRLKRVKI